MSILVNSKDTFDIPVVIGVLSSARPVKYFAILGPSSPDTVKATETWPAGTTISFQNFTFKSPDFKTNSEIIDSAVEIIDGKVRINSAKLRFTRLTKTMVGWDLLDDNGKAIPCTIENISQLPSPVAAVLGDELDRSQETI